MEEEDVINLYNQWEENGITVWIDGGWGVDALLGKQTRPHSDLDIAVERSYVPLLRKLLTERGYGPIPRNDTTEWNFHLGDKTHEVDIHVFADNPQTDEEKDMAYPGGSLTGEGTIAGQTVRCIAPDFMVRFHSGYELKEKDFQDVSALCKKFGIALPEEYAHFLK